MCRMTDQQFAKIGKVAVNFGSIEELLTYRICAFMQCADFDVALGSVKTMNFEAKVQRLEWLIEHHATKRGVTDASIVKEWKEMLGKLRRFAGQRNEIFHSFHSSETPGQISFRAVKTDRPVDVSDQALQELIDGMVDALTQTAHLIKRFMEERQIDTRQFTIR